MSASTSRNKRGSVIPIINIMLREGRTLEQKRQLAKKLTEDMVAIAQVPPESVTITFSDFSKSDWASGGCLASDKVLHTPEKEEK